jgi:hypothetical protein
MMTKNRRQITDTSVETVRRRFTTQSTLNALSIESKPSFSRKWNLVKPETVLLPLDFFTEEIRPDASGHGGEMACPQ